MTANAFEEDREKCMEAGMNGYLSESVSAEQLMDMIRKLILLL